MIKYALCVLQSYLHCFERFIKFLNKNAYIQIAITGNSFCVAAKDAFFIILRNAFLFTIAAGLGEVFMTVGKVFICAFSTFACYTILTTSDIYEDKVFYPLAVMLVLPPPLCSSFSFRSAS